MSSLLLFIKRRKEEREEDEEMVIRFSSEKSGRCVTLVVVKGLLRRISRRDRVAPSRATGESPALIGSGTYLSGSGLPARFESRPTCLAMLGRHCLALVRFPRSPHPSRNERRARCLSDCLGCSVLSDTAVALSEGFLGTDVGAYGCLFRSRGADEGGQLLLRDIFS